MRQPKFSVRNSEIATLYKNELTIPLGKKCSSTIIGIIGDERETSNGTMIPVALYQRRTDVGNGTIDASPEFSQFTGLGFNTIVKHIQNITKEAFNAQSLKEGMVITNAHLAVDRQVGKPFYQLSDGSDQEPIINPSTGEKVTCNGEHVYRNTRLAFGEVEHLGHDIVYDVQESVEVETEEASLVLEEEF